MLAITRKRRGVISEVKPFDGEDGVLHLVRLDYKDGQQPDAEEFVSELEAASRLLEPHELPRSTDPAMMTGEEFDALVRSAAFSSISRKDSPPVPAVGQPQFARVTVSEDAGARTLICWADRLSQVR